MVMGLEPSVFPGSLALGAGFAAFEALPCPVVSGLASVAVCGAGAFVAGATDSDFFGTARF